MPIHVRIHLRRRNLWLKQKLPEKQRTASVYIILTILAVLDVPHCVIILTSFRGEGGAFVPYIIPKTFTLENYKVLLTNQTGNFPLSIGFEHLVRFHRKLSVINFHYNRNGLCAVTVAFPLKKTIFKSGARFKYVPWFYEYDCRLLYFKSLKFN